MSFDGGLAKILAVATTGQTTHKMPATQAGVARQLRVLWQRLQNMHLTISDACLRKVAGRQPVLFRNIL